MFNDGLENAENVITGVLSAVCPLQRNISDEFLRSVSGISLLPERQPVRLSDVVYLVLPAFAHRVKAVVREVPAKPAELETFLLQLIGSCKCSLLFATQPILEPMDAEDAPAPDRLITGWTRLPYIKPCTSLPDDLHWQKPDAAVGYTHAVRLTQTTLAGPRKDNFRDTLLRWVAFAAAWPERVFEGGDTARLHDVGRFIHNCSASQRTRVHSWLRQAAALLLADDPRAAFPLLTQALLPALRLPETMADALTLPPHVALDPVQRRELIYLARAGVPLLQVLAARRLQPERELPEVDTTLQQLAMHAHPWVRAAARA